MDLSSGQESFGSHPIDQAVSLLAGPTETGRAFFDTAVEALALGLECRWAVIGALSADKKSVDMISFWADAGLAEPMSYSLAEGPCDLVYQSQTADNHHFYPDGITELFPRFGLLKALGAKAYRGEMFFGADGEPAGHVVALMDKRQNESPQARALFRLITQRAGAEFKRWKLEEALRKSEDNYRGLISMLPDCVVIHRDGKIIYANSAAAQTLGASDPKDLIGYPAIEVAHPDDRERIAERIQKVMNEGRVVQHAQQRYQRLDGSSFESESSGSRFEFDEGPAAVVVFRDVTQRRQLEEQLLQAQKLDAVGKLTGGIAHDFNNLLSVIIGNAEILEEGTSPKSTRKTVEAIIRVAERGTELTDQLLTFARRQRLQARSIALPELLKGLGNMIKRTIGENISVDIQAAHDVWPVFADPGKLENALLNLALNARDAMPEGGKLTIACRNFGPDDALPEAEGGPLEETEGREPEPAPDASPKGDFVVLTITDTGRGMTPEVSRQAFEPFFSQKDTGRGSGLGLSMVHGFTKQSGGHISLQSRPGQGTEVSLYLPRNPDPHQDSAREPEESVPRGRGEKILVVEDEAELRELTAGKLGALGYKVEVAGDGPTALQLLTKSNSSKIRDSFDLVLCDVVLPGGMNGSEFASAARRQDPDLKIILISGMPRGEDKGRGDFPSGVERLQKPCPQDKLARALRALLD